MTFKNSDLSVGCLYSELMIWSEVLHTIINFKEYIKAVLLNDLLFECRVPLIPLLRNKMASVLVFVLLNMYNIANFLVLLNS